MMRPVETTVLRTLYERLINTDNKEQEYQSFLESHPQFIPREFIQNHGLHLDVIFRKLQIGTDYICDFAYLSKSSCEWNCILIEIEKPSSRFFKENSNDFHPDFHKAYGQIEKWLAALEQDPTRGYVAKATLEKVLVPSAMYRNPVHFYFVLVHGRRHEYKDSETRRSLLRTRETKQIKILSYDNLLDGFTSNRDAYIAVKKSETIDITSKRYVSDHLFAMVPSKMIRINRTLRDDIIASKDKWFTMVDFHKHVLDEALPNLKHFA